MPAPPDLARSPHGPTAARARARAPRPAMWACLAVWLLASTALWLACGAGTRQTLLPRASTAPPDIRDACTRADLRCSTCHPLDRVVDYQHRGRTSWEQAVKRMRLKPESGITVAEAGLIVDCLVYLDTLPATASTQ